MNIAILLLSTGLALSPADTSRLSLDNAVARALEANAPGTLVLASLALGTRVSAYFFLFTAFVGLNLLQSSFTRWCLMERILEKAGVGQAADQKALRRRGPVQIRFGAPNLDSGRPKRRTTARTGTLAGTAAIFRARRTRYGCCLFSGTSSQSNLEQSCHRS
jgi:hypothetical protein